jgi:hypothetical protein
VAAVAGVTSILSLAMVWITSTSAADQVSEAMAVASKATETMSEAMTRLSAEPVAQEALPFFEGALGSDMGLAFVVGFVSALVLMMVFRGIR